MKIARATLAAGALGALAALSVAAVPGAMLEQAVSASGLPAVIAAAEPPLGMTARIALALAAGLVVAGVARLLLLVILGDSAEGAAVEARDDAPAPPSIRRADAHPDAPPRPPLLATRDLGTPFLEVRAGGKPDEDDAPLPALPEPVPLTAPVIDADARPLPLGPAVPRPAANDLPPLQVREAPSEPEWSPPPAAHQGPPPERPLPEDFDQPLAAFDPQAIPAEPMAPPLSLKPLRRPVAVPSLYDANDRLAIFEQHPPFRRPAPAPPPSLRPLPRDEAPAAPPPEREASVHALLERLERGAMARGLITGSERHDPPAPPAPTPAPAERGLEEALVTLRNLARRA